MKNGTRRGMYLIGEKVNSEYICRFRGPDLMGTIEDQSLTPGVVNRQAEFISKAEVFNSIRTGQP